MQNSIVKKSLVIGIIFLIIGVGIQPIYANEILFNCSSKNVEDCNYQVIENNKLEKYKNQIGKSETYSKLLLLINDNKKFKKVYENLKNNISLDGRPICDKLENMWWDTLDKATESGKLGFHYRSKGNWVIAFYYFSICMIFFFIHTFIDITYRLLGCGCLPKY